MSNFFRQVQNKLQELSHWVRMDSIICENKFLCPTLVNMLKMESIFQFSEETKSENFSPKTISKDLGLARIIIL